MLVNKILAVIIAQFTFKYLLNIKITTVRFLKAIKVPVVASTMAGGAGYLASTVLGWHTIVCMAIVGISYVATVWLLMKQELIDQFNQFSSLRKRKVIQVN